MKERKSDYGKTLIAKLYASGKSMLNIAKERNCKPKILYPVWHSNKKHKKVNIQEFREYCFHDTFFIVKNEFQTTKMSGETSLT